MKTGGRFGVTFVLMAAFAMQAGADTLYLQADKDLSLGGDIAGNTAADGSGSAVSKTKDAGGPPYTYDFSDVATGGGTPTTGGFVGGVDFQSRKLYNTANSNNFTLDMGGNDLIGSSGVTNIFTYRGTGNTLFSANVAISNVGAVALGVIDTHTAGGNGSGARSNAGNLTVGGLNAPAGAVRIDAVDTHAGNSSGGTVTTGAGGNVRIFGSGDVLIQNAAGTVRGDIRTHHWSAQKAGDIEVQHDGSFRANDLLAFAVINWSSAKCSPGNVTCNGDVLGNNPSGTFEVHTVKATIESDYGFNPPDGILILLKGYTGALITGNIQTYVNDLSSTAKAGSVTVSNITGNVTIMGSIDLNQVASDALDGNLSLHCGGSITVSNLNLSKVLYAKFDPGVASYITGTITGTNGLAATPDMVTSLRTPLNKYVFYNRALNPGLNGQQVPLKAINGTDAGGMLSPPIPQGTMVLQR